MVRLKIINDGDRKGKVLPLSNDEKEIIYEFSNNNLLLDLEEVSEKLSTILKRDKATLRNFMWHNGLRPREYQRTEKYIERIAQQVAKENGFEDRPAAEPSEALTKIFKKILHQRLVNGLKK